MEVPLFVGRKHVTYNNLATIVKDTNEPRETFFRLLFGPTAQGHICIAFLSSDKKNLREHWFEYPQELPLLLDTIVKESREINHAYFCPQLFRTRDFKRSDGKGPRVKENVLSCTVVWADLDTCDPALLLVEPTVLIQSSPGRWQAYWVLNKETSPVQAESISRKIAYAHAVNGADRSGWDLTQLLRIPYTANHKYGDLVTSAPIVAIVSANNRIYQVSDFNRYPEIQAVEFTREEAPEILKDDPREILQKYRSTLNPTAFELFVTTPEHETWSEKQWKLIQFCVEAGLTRQQTYTVLHHAACNKFARDGRPPTELWDDVCRGYVKHLEIKHAIPTATTVINELLSEEEVERVQGKTTFVERYIQWASKQTDAAVQYHQAGALTILSGLLSANLVLRTSFGSIVPNLWFAVLGETTLTRKSTAIKLATSIINKLDDEIMFATDGTSEGILSGLVDREGKASLFFRDEITGLFQAMLVKDYMSDMPEHFTRLYDGDTVKRRLRKEEIVVKDPVFIILCGGIKTKVQMMLGEEHIASGFIPRFVFITAEADISQLRPIGPPRKKDHSGDVLVEELVDIRDHYRKSDDVILDGKVIESAPRKFEVELTKKAWKRYNEFETLMLKEAIETGQSYRTAMYDRLAKSTLKVAMLIAASEQRSYKVVVDVEDLVHAIYYCTHWRTYANDVICNIGKSHEERLIDSLYVEVKESRGGKTRHELMRSYKLSKKVANEIFDTMEQRQLIHGIRIGNDVKYQAI